MIQKILLILEDMGRLLHYMKPLNRLANHKCLRIINIESTGIVRTCAHFLEGKHFEEVLISDLGSIASTWLDLPRKIKYDIIDITIKVFTKSTKRAFFQFNNRLIFRHSRRIFRSGKSCKSSIPFPANACIGAQWDNTDSAGISFEYSSFLESALVHWFYYLTLQLWAIYSTASRTNSSGKMNYQ